MIKYRARIKRNKKKRKINSLKNKEPAPRTQGRALRRKVVIATTAVKLFHIKIAVRQTSIK